jgi:hypothetical protein
MNHFLSPSKKNFARTRMGSNGAMAAGATGDGALGARTSGMERALFLPWEYGIGK